MKKTKIIIPGLALVALSTVASIAGSVAWFTASRTATVNAGSFSVVKTTSNLTCVVTAGMGTYLDASDTTNKTITLTHEVGEGAEAHDVTNVLTDASFNHLTGNIYQPDESGEDFHEDYPEVSCTDASLATKLNRGETLEGGAIYSAVTFNLSFTISFGSASGNYGLFLDNTAGKTEVTCEDATLYTAKGFRMAFYSTDGNATSKVLADLQDNGTWDHDGDGAQASPTAEVKKIRYTADNNDFVTDVTDYAATDLMHSGYTDSLPAENTAEATVALRPDYLGKFAFQANTDVTLNYTVVCWFDGNDPEIVNRDLASEYQTVESVLCFEAIKIGA